MSKATIVLITGANSGVGYATAQMLVHRSADYHVIIASRTEAKGEKAVAAIQAESPKGTLSTVQLDVTDQASVQRAADQVQRDFGRVDVLINNAGTESYHFDTLEQRLVVLMRTNAIGAVLVTQTFKTSLLKSSNPRLLYISSALGSITHSLDESDPITYSVTLMDYQMSKAAMNMAAAVDHKTLGKQGVKVWALCPGFVDSNLRQNTDNVREMEKQFGMLPASTSADFIIKTIEGERDADVGKFIKKDGVYPW